MRPLATLTALAALVGALGAPVAAGASPVAGQIQVGPSPDTGGADAGAPVGQAVEPEAAADAEPVTQEQEQGDEEIRARLQALFDRIGSLQDVQVEVEAGLVRLQGEALTPEARQQALELARQTEGVLFVEDDLRVVTDLSERLQPAVDRIREYALDAVAFLPLLAVAFAIVVLMLLLGSWVSRWDGPHMRLAGSPFIRGLVRQVVHFGFGLAGILVALELLDATALVGAVLGTAGVLGLAVGFAFKDIVENHLAGIMLSLRQPFAPNDHIVVGDHEGKVVRLTARETILMTLAGNHVRIPNAELYRSVLTNYTRNRRRRFDVRVAVGTDEDLVLAQDVGVQALREMQGVMDDPEPSSEVVELGDSWVTVQFLGWVNQEEADFIRVRSEAVRLVKMSLDQAGIAMPSPEFGLAVRATQAVSGAEALRIEAPSAPEKRRPRRPTATPAEAEGAGPPRMDLEQRDVSVDHTLDEQIEEDRRTSQEGDLLTEDDAGPAGSGTDR